VRHRGFAVRSSASGLVHSSARGAADTCDRCAAQRDCVLMERNRRHNLVGGAAIFGVPGAGVGASIGLFVKHDVWCDRTDALRRQSPE
jgi:hypothetical protein